MTRRSLVLAMAPPLLAPRREELLRLPNYTAFDWLVVSSEQGKLILSGWTPNPALKQAAETLLQLSGSSIEMLSHAKPDEELRLAVWKKLQSDSGLKALKPAAPFHRDALLGAHSIHILVHQGIVTLRGRVTTAAQSSLANRLANAVPGIEQVHNYLVSTP